MSAGLPVHCKEEHQWVNVQRRGGNSRLKEKQSPNRLWETECNYQQFFRVPGWKRYFQVGRHNPLIEQSQEVQSCGTGGPQVSNFSRQQEDTRQSENAAMLAKRVQGFDDHRLAAIPWLRTTGIADHVKGLDKGEIQAAMALPRDGEGALSVILTSMQEVL